MKSGKIVKIRWNRVKTRFHHQFNAFSKEDKMWIIVPSSSRCPVIIGLLHTQNKSKITFSLFSFSQSSKFQQSTTGPPPTTLFFFIFPSSTASFSPATVRSRFQTIIAVSLQSPPAIISYFVYLFSPLAKSIMI